MKTATQLRCLICNSNQYKTVFYYSSPDSYEKAVGVAEKNYFRKWVRCSLCGFYYSVYSRDPKILKKIYSEKYRDKNSSWRSETSEDIFRKIISLSEKDSETKFRARWIKNNLKEIWDSEIIKKSEHPMKALDIGGGAGIFAYEFNKDPEWKTYVIDPSKNNDFIKTKLKIPLKQTFYKPEAFKTKFDLITLIYVLEHVNNPINLLKSIKKDLAKNSSLFIEVPDSISFSKKPKNDDVFNSCHLWIFDPKSLALFLDKCGYELLNIKRLKSKRGHYCLMAIAKLKQFN